MKKYFVKMEHTHSVTFGLCFMGGNFCENQDMEGISHLLEHLVFRRIGDLKNEELYREMNKRGVVMEGATYQTLVAFYIQMPPEDLKVLAEILFRIFNGFEWTAEEIRKEKDVVLRQIETDSVYYFYEKDKEKYFQGTPYYLSIMGDEEGIEKIGTETVHSIKRQLFHPSRAACILTGAFSDEDRNYIEKMISEAEKKSSIPVEGDFSPRVNALPKNFGKRTSADDFLIQSCLEPGDAVISFDVSKECDERAVRLLCAILTEGDGAKLSWKLKDVMGICGDVEGETDRYPGFTRLTFGFSAHSGCMPLALETVIDEIVRLKEGVTAEDLEAAIRFFTFLPELEDNPKEFWRNIAEEAFLYPGMPYGAKAVSTYYDEVDTEMLTSHARRIFCSENLYFGVKYSQVKVKGAVLKKKMKELRKRL